MAKRKGSVPDIQKACDDILALMNKNQNELCKAKNKPFLAYLMLRWQVLFNAGRTVYGDQKHGYQCQNNPKYEFESMATNDRNESIIYDAWGASIGFIQLLPPDLVKKYKYYGESTPQFDESDFDELATYFNKEDSFTKLQFKKNKTMDDWYAMLGDPNYRYHSLYETKKSIDNHLLCVVGNGYDWNKQGFLCDDGPSGEDTSDFGKYPMLKGHSGNPLEAELNKILMQPHVQEALSKAKEKTTERVLAHKKKEFLERFFMVIHCVTEVVLTIHLTEEQKKERKDDSFGGTPNPELNELVMTAIGQYPKRKELIKDLKALDKAREGQLKRPKGMSYDDAMKWNKKTPPSKESEALSTKVWTHIKPIEALLKKLVEVLPADKINEFAEWEQRNLTEIVAKMEGGKKLPNREEVKGDYYPLSNYSRMCKMPDNVHPSYVKVAIEICEEIVKYCKPKSDKKHDIKHAENQILEAKRLLTKLGKKGYDQDIPWEADKYEVLKKVQDFFEPVKALYPTSKKTNYYEQPINTSLVYLNDTKKNEYANNHIYVHIKFDPTMVPKGISNDLETLKKSAVYKPFKKFLSDIRKIKGVFSARFFYENLDMARIEMEIVFLGDPDYLLEQAICDAKFMEKGFMIGNHIMALELKDVILVTSKSETLGSTHPNNEDGEQYFSNNQFFDVYNKQWKKIDSYQIDERGFNSFNGGKKTDLTAWLHEQHKMMKESNSDYGTGKREGKKNLYSHDFMLWLKEHEVNEVMHS